jgi:sugar/nucleoside kinase (ribokinase family)
MSSSQQAAGHDVVGIGNAIVDVLCHAEEALLDAEALVKGSMTLIDAARAEALYGRIGPSMQVSGGSAANTMAGIASFGGRAAYIGKVRDDQLGAEFAHDLKAIGVTFQTEPANDGAPTARSFVLVTPDAQRTMCTYLGACVGLTPADIDADLVADAQVLYLEGYLWDPPEAKKAFVHAAEVAHAAGREVALSLSDSFCVERHQESFRQLVAHHVDVLFANEKEACALYQVGTFEEALQHATEDCEVVALTRSDKGSVVAAGEAAFPVMAVPVDPVVDTTGAGDLYAAGFLFGYTRGYEPVTCGRLGSLAAAEVISHIGARPDESLAQLAEDELERAERRR